MSVGPMYFDFNDSSFHLHCVRWFQRECVHPVFWLQWFYVHLVRWYQRAYSHCVYWFQWTWVHRVCRIWRQYKVDLFATFAVGVGALSSNNETVCPDNLFFCTVGSQCHHVCWAQLLKLFELQRLQSVSIRAPRCSKDWLTYVLIAMLAVPNHARSSSVETLYRRNFLIATFAVSNHARSWRSETFYHRNFLNATFAVSNHALSQRIVSAASMCNPKPAFQC